MRGLSFIPVLIGAGLACAQSAKPVEEIDTLIASEKDGAEVHIPAGDYHGTLRIARPVRLIADGNVTIDAGGQGDGVEIVAPDVELRGFTVRGTGIDLDKESCGIRVTAPRARLIDNTLEDVLFGIDLKQAPGSVVRGNRIGGKDLDIARRGDGLRLWRSNDTVVENNTIHDGRDAILWYSDNITVRGNRSFRCRYGFHLMYSNSVTIEDNDLTENSVGVYFMYSEHLVLVRNRLVRNRGPSGYGLGLKETSDYRIEENTFSGNRVGLYIDGSPLDHANPPVIVRNVIACNDIGAAVLPSSTGNRIHDNAFLDNFEQVSVQGRGQISGNEFADNGRGNFWSDYAGYDADRDGIGDGDYESTRLFENLVDREPKLRMLLFSPAEQAIEFVARALPAVQPEPKFTDPFPLMSPPVIATAASSLVPARGPFLGLAGGLFAAAGVVTLGGLRAHRRVRG